MKTSQKIKFAEHFLKSYKTFMKRNKFSELLNLQLQNLHTECNTGASFFF